jgi:hypothetical protein
MSRHTRMLTAATFALVLVACERDIGGPTDDDGTPPDSATTFLLTDAPFPYDLLARVDIYIERVDVSVTADTGWLRDSTGAEFITATAPGRRINVLELQHGVVDTLGGTRLPAASYRSLSLVINADSSSITLKDGRLLTRASSPGIDWQLHPDSSLVAMWALVHEPLGIPDTGGTIVVDFDVGRNFMPIQEIDSTSNDEGFLSFNTVRAVKLERSGTITGRAVDTLGIGVAEAAVTAFLPFNPELPENTWSELATTCTDASGYFTIAYLTPTNFWDNTPHIRRYIIGVDGVAGSGLGKARYFDIELAAGETLDVGTMVLEEH